MINIGRLKWVKKKVDPFYPEDIVVVWRGGDDKRWPTRNERFLENKVDDKQKGG